MKYLILVLMFFTVSAHATVRTDTPNPNVIVVDEDCSALGDIARAVTIMRMENVPEGIVREKIKTKKNMQRKEYVALLPMVTRIVNDIYSKDRVLKTPALESEAVYMRCMDHIYAGTDF